VLALVVASSSLSRTVGPLALALAAMLVSSALFARAVERGNACGGPSTRERGAAPAHAPDRSERARAQLAASPSRTELDLRLALPAVAVAVSSAASS
jgi:hypothetical protein